MALFQAILAYIHSWLDYALSLCRMAKNREIGWVTVVRKTGQYKREQQPIMKKLKLLLLFNPLVEWIDTTRVFRHYLHEKANIQGHDMAEPESAKKIKAFVDFYGINMDEFEPSDINAYKNFQEFFTRRHKPGTRPIHTADDPRIVICPADCRTVVYDSVPHARKLWIKGRHFTITNLVADEKLGQVWDEGMIASFRLSPQDYHRYHCPVDGTVKWWKHLPGDYYGVDPLAVGSDIDVLTSNARVAVEVESEAFGRVLFVAIGASEVGTVKFHEDFRTPGRKVRKGEEIGFFEFGGSSIIVCFEKGRIEFDQDLKMHSLRREEVDVEMGMSLGKVTKV